jgi:tetratricopeptide (TPR) repeat protein
MRIKHKIIYFAVVLFLIDISFCGLSFSDENVSLQSCSKKIEESVISLEYPKIVGKDLNAFVEDWKLDEWQRKLNEANISFREKKITATEITAIEIEILNSLTKKIQESFPVPDDEVVDGFDLEYVIKHKKTDCIGYSQLLYILGNSVGLRIFPINVTEYSSGSSLPAGENHQCCLVNLKDGNVIIADLTRSNSVVFKFDDYFFKSGNYWKIKKANKQILPACLQLLDNNGLLAALHSNRGMSYLKMGNYQKAHLEFSDAIRLNPLYSEAYLNRGLALSKENKPSEAMIEYEKAINVNPDNAEAYNNRGNLLRKLGKYDKAIQDFSKAIELKQNFYQALNNRGIVYNNNNQLKKALSDFNKAIEINENYSNAYYNRGVLYERENNYKKALADYTKAIENEPEMDLFYIRRGSIYEQLQDYSHAVIDYTTAIEINPKSPDLLYKRGMAYVTQNKIKEGLDDLKKAAEMDGNYKKAYDKQVIKSKNDEATKNKAEK